MANLTYIDKAKIESFLGMKTGYVLDFSDRTFQEFIGESVGIDIYDEKYMYASGSKANRLRAYIKSESNYNVGKLLNNFLEYWMAKVQMGEIDYYNVEDLYKECLRIAERLMQDTAIEHITVFDVKESDKDLKLLSKSIKDSIANNEPEIALDRLHTFVVKFIRELCDSHNIQYSKSETLNAIFGKYVKNTIEKNLLESTMSEKILKYSINILEAFNDVRNNKSLAHDNSILNYDESILIFNNILNSIKFIQKIESRNNEAIEPPKIDPWDELPF